MILPELVRGMAWGAMKEINATSTLRKLRTAAAIFRASGSDFGFFHFGHDRERGFTVFVNLEGGHTIGPNQKLDAFSTTSSISWG